MTSSQISELRSKIYALFPPLAFGDSPEGHAASHLEKSNELRNVKYSYKVRKLRAKR